MVHIHFDVDDAMEEESPQTTASAQSSWSQGFKLPHCCNVASVGGAYVFRVSATCDGIVASTSDHVIKAYSLSSSQLNHVCDLRGHGGSITDVAFTVSPSMLHSSSVDGTIKGWDLRTTGQAERLALTSLPAFKPAYVLPCRPLLCDACSWCMFFQLRHATRAAFFLGAGSPAGSRRPGGGVLMGPPVIEQAPAYAFRHTHGGCDTGAVHENLTQ